MTLEQLSVDHKYYCTTTNYYSNAAGETFQTWQQFLDDFRDADMDYNLIFRWDIKKHDSDEKTGYYMEIFIVHQRKGRFIPIQIEQVTEADVPLIVQFLTPRFRHLMELWKPLNKLNQ